jgi:iron complex outermembrane receptor protein
MRSIRCALSLTALLFLSTYDAALTQAQPRPAERDTAIYDVPTVTVRGARPLASPGGSGSVTARIDSLSVPAVPTVEQVLRALPGTYLRTNSRGESEVTVRGSESRQVAILVDGAPLTFAWDGRADVSVIPALAIQEVTLVRGLSTLTQGPNSLGGVIELSTRPVDHDRRAPSAQLRGGVDELGGFGVAGSVSVPRDTRWGVLTTRGGFGMVDSPGFPLPRGIEEAPPADPDERLNTDFEEQSGFLSLRRRNGAFVSLLGVGYRAERGIAAQLGFTDARFWRYPYIGRGIGVLSAGTSRHAMPWGGAGDLQVSGGYDRGRTEIDAYDSRAYTTLDTEEDGNDRVLTLRSSASQTIGERADLRLAFSYGDIRHDEILGGVLNEYRQTLWSGAAQTSVRLPGTGVVRSLDLSAGGTFDAADTPKSGNKPPFESLDQVGGRFGVSALLGDGATTAHASVSRRARFPSLRELYSGALGSFEPNPDLKPEHLLAIEAGITARTPAASVQLVGFHHRLSDAVVRIRPPGQNFQRVNQEGVRSAGVEVLAARAFAAIEIGADVIVQDVKVLDPSAGLTRPENMPEIMGSVRVQAPVGAGVLAALEARYKGEQFVIDPENSVVSRLAPCGHLDVELYRNWPLSSGVGWFRGLQLRATLDNLTDSAQFDAFGLPQPGRTLQMQLRLW